MSFPIYFVKGKEKNNSVISNCRSFCMAYHYGLSAFPSALPRHLWQQLAALRWLAACRLWNGGREVACASWGFSFFVRRTFSSSGVLLEAEEQGVRTCSVAGCLTWLSCCRQGCWVACSAGICRRVGCAVPRKTNRKWGLRRVCLFPSPRVFKTPKLLSHHCVWFLLTYIEKIWDN